MILNFTPVYFVQGKKKFSKEPVFSLLPSSKGRSAQLSIFTRWAQNARMPSPFTQRQVSSSWAWPHPGTAYTHQAHRLRTWIQCWERGPWGTSSRSDVLQPTGRSPNHRTSSFLCTWFSVAWKVKEVTKHTATKTGGKNSSNMWKVTQQDLHCLSSCPNTELNDGSCTPKSLLRLWGVTNSHQEFVLQA